jgi:hypothetical protein
VGPQKMLRLDDEAFFIVRYRRLSDCAIFEGWPISFNLLRRAIAAIVQSFCRFFALLIDFRWSREWKIEDFPWDFKSYCFNLISSINYSLQIAISFNRGEAFFVGPPES